jgi:hypothetical protein
LFGQEQGMRGAYAPETKILNGLGELECSHRNFVDIAKGCGVRVAYGPFSEIMNHKDNRDFENELAKRLLELVNEMRTLNEETVAPIDWAGTERVCLALTVRRLAKANVEAFGDQRLDAVALLATKSVGS